MFSVSFPWLLLGLLSIFIPLIIHLLNKSRGRLVKVGSIELLRNLTTNQVRQVKLMRWLLLIIRMLIFALVTLIIAQLWLQKKQPLSNKGEVLVSQSWLNMATEEELDTLFLAHLNDNISLLSDTRIKLSSQSWQHTLQQMNLTQQPISPERVWPSIVKSLHLHNSAKPLNVYMTNDNALSSFIDVTLSKVQLGNRGLDDIQQPINWHIKDVYLSNLETPMQFKQGEIRVAIYQQPNRNTQSLKSALEILQQYHWPNMTIQWLSGAQLSKLSTIGETQKNISSSSSRLESPDVLFYLSDGPLENHLVEVINAGMMLIKDADLESVSRNPKTSKTSKISTGQYTINSVSPLLNKSIVGQYIHPHHTIKLPLNKTRSVMPNNLWTLNNGDSLLSIQTQGAGKILRFSSRFQADWFTGIDQPEFVSVVALLLSHHQDVYQYQRYNISPSQLELALRQGTLQSASPKDNETTNALKSNHLKEKKQSLFHFLAVSLLLLWLAERIISERYYRA